MSELIKVYSPAGEMFENSPENARDLVTHVGWSYLPPKGAVAAVEVFEKIEPKAEEVIEETPIEVAEEVIEEVDAVEEETSEDKPSTRGRRKK